MYVCMYIQQEPQTLTHTCPSLLYIALKLILFQLEKVAW